MSAKFVAESKDPDATLDYKVDWTTSWLPSGDSVSSATWTATGVTVDSDSLQSGIATVWLSGGTAGEIATATCRVVTVGGRIDDRTIFIPIAER